MIKSLLSILTIFSIISCSSLKNNGKNNNSISANDSLTSELNQILEQGYFNGFGVAIVNENGPLYEKGFGFSDVSSRKIYTEETIQNIGSVSKTFVGVALMKAQELGKLKLDDPINNFLPFNVINPNFPESQITIRQLANHTSTIIDNEFYLTKNYFLKPNQDLTGFNLIFDETQVFNPFDSVVSMKTFLENILTTKGKWYQKDGFSNRKPGEIYEYSNTGTTLAAYIIELATGLPFDEFTEKYILKPLKMDASGWKFSDVDFSKYSRLYENPKTVLPFYGMVSYPDGNFITSAKDLSKYLTELIKGYNGNGTILSRESYLELFRPQLASNNFLERNERNPYSESYNVGIFMGFGFTGYVGHTGGDPGVMSLMFFDTKTNIGRLMIFNTNFSDKAGNDAFYGIWNVLEKYQPRLKNTN
jgi:CubicO group peptidase (beta-lactamase class C family)